MGLTVSGPMFEPAETEFWRSESGREGAHYNTYHCRDEHGMAALRAMFPKGTADEMNVCLFSTSGVHGSYGTIEEAETEWVKGTDEYGDPADPNVTFLIVQPRICCLRYGNCEPRTTEDFAFLKRLRQSSWDALQAIGRDEA